MEKKSKDSRQGFQPYGPLEFARRKEVFFVEHEVYRKLPNVQKREMLDRWTSFMVYDVVPFSSGKSSLQELKELQEEMERKTSQDGLLKIGFQLEDLAKANLPMAENPFHFAPTLRGFARRKMFLQSVFEKIFVNAPTFGKNKNADKGEKF